MANGSEECRRGYRIVDDQRQTVAVCEISHRLYIEEAQLRVARQFAVEKACVFVDARGPGINISWIFDPAALHSALFLEAHLEQLVGASIALRGRHKISLLVDVISGVHQKWLHGHHDRRHPRAR